MTTAAVEVEPLEELRRKTRALFAPPPDLTVSEFADRELVVTSGPLAGTHWQTDFAPYQRGILDAVHEPGVETIVVQGSSQWGKTACAVAVDAYYIAHDPCPILVVEPTVDPMAKDFAKNRLNPVIEASPILKDRVSRRREKDGSNTTLAKTYRGGALAVGGANSAASLAARSVRLLVLDEIDRYPAELPGEGNTIELAIKRTTAYRQRRRVLMLSSPTERGAPVDAWFQAGDQRRYYVPCPKCDHMHCLAWANVKWSNDDASTARLECPGCAYRFGDAERLAVLARGEWRAEAPARRDPTIVSFHLWEAYSPLSSLPQIVRGFLRARAAQKAGDRSVMHTWQNTTLGEPHDPDEGEGLEPHALLLRREPYPHDVDAPAGVVAITLGVDVQDDRLEVLTVGWGPGEEAWLLDRDVIPGDPSRPEPWRNLDGLLALEFRHGLGGPALHVAATCIDSAGHRTAEVYDYVHRNAARRVYATIGRAGPMSIISKPSARRWGRELRHVDLHTLGVDAAKSLIMSRLSVTEKGPGYVHIPHADWADEELALQLTSERLVTKWDHGRPVSIWKKVRPRNEALDCFVLALAALRLLNPRLDQWAEALRREAAGLPATAPQAPRESRDPWLSRRPGGWLRRG